MLHITQSEKDAILNLFQDCDFNESELLNEDNYYQKIVAKLNNKVKNFDYFNGVSKCVFLFEQYPDIVVKIPFNGGVDYRSYSSSADGSNDYDYYDDSSEYSCADLSIVNCKGMRRNWDYCEVEEVLFNRAYKAGVNDYFAQTAYIGEINGYPIYIQERAEIYSDSEVKYSYKLIKELIEEIKQDLGDSDRLFGRLPDEWVCDFYVIYGKDLLVKFLNFVEEQEISDLHSDNVGFIDDKPVLTDYSSFWSQKGSRNMKIKRDFLIADMYDKHDELVNPIYFEGKYDTFYGRWVNVDTVAISEQEIKEGNIQWFLNDIYLKEYTAIPASLRDIEDTLYKVIEEISDEYIKDSYTFKNPRILTVEVEINLVSATLNQ